MDHTYIEKHDMIDRYVLGSLVADEQDWFEGHIVECSQCLDKVDLTRDFVHAVRTGVARSLRLANGGQPQARSKPLSEKATERRLGLFRGRMRIRGDIVNGCTEEDWEMLE